METKHLLTRDRNNLLKIGLKSQDKSLEDLQRSIGEVRDWIKHQQNVPEIPSNYIF